MEIASEKIIFEDGQYYEIIVSRAARKPLNYTEEDLIFGPVLRRERHPLFIRKLEEELKRYQEIGYENVREKIERIKEQLYENQNDR
jgi:tRNA (adenine22-N1)-methyltransferase